MRKTLTALVLLALLPAGCGATPSTLSTMTPVPRTPRATATATPAPTPTGTPVPTATPITSSGGFYIVVAPNPCNAENDIAHSYSATAAGDSLLGSWTMCPAGSEAYVYGWLHAHAEGFTPAVGAGLNPDWVDPDPTYTDTDTSDGCRTVTRDMVPYTFHLTGLSNFSVNAASLDWCDDWAYSEIAWEFTEAPGPPGPTPTPAAGCGITEVYTRYGATCADYNLRGGCGTDDEFIEVECTPAQSLAGWQLAASDVLTYTIKADNMTGPLKVFWLDQWPTWTVTTTLPLTGTATLINAAATPVSTRTWQTIPGYSWAATNWTAPGGPWYYYAPSPGY